MLAIMEKHEKVKSLRHYSDLLLDQCGLKSYLISVTGSLAWGTDTEDSDVDLTVIGIDVRPDVFHYPRQSTVFKMQDGDEEIDVRFFTLPSFLRLVQKSNLVPYETMFGFRFSNSYIWQCLADLVLQYFSPYDAMMKAQGTLGSLLRQDLDNAKTRRKIYYFYSLLVQAIALHERHERRDPNHGFVVARYPILNVESFRQKLHRTAKATSAELKYVATIDGVYAWSGLPDVRNKKLHEEGALIDPILPFVTPFVIELVEAAIQKSLVYANNRVARLRLGEENLNAALTQLFRMGYN